MHIGMCGLVGIYRYAQTETPSVSALASGIKSLAHRGPDAHGDYLGAGIALGHTRLSFLDLSPDGNQPLWDPTGRYCIVYNGEIYNFRKLRLALESRGCRFKSNSDTEVLLQGLISEGPEFLRKAEGMFAFAFYDRGTHRLVLGRDRFGIKPLFWSKSKDGLAFASEIKALRGMLSFSPNEKRLAAFLGGFDLPTEGETMIEGVSFFPTGCVAEVGSDGVRVTPFFELKEFWRPDTRKALQKLSTARLIDRFDELLNESVKQHMISDVPVGALCSGGVDSSIILALAKNHSSSLAIYHANVVGPHSELEAARTLADHLKLDLISVDVADKDFVDRFPDVIEHLEFPFLYHPNSIPFLLVSKLVESHGTKAVLTGEGSDELLLGYSHIPSLQLVNRYHSVMDAFRRLFHRLPWVGRTFWRTPGDQQASLARDILSGFDGSRIPDFASPLGNSSQERTRRTQYQLIDHHLRTLLMRNDRLGMASSIEARFPFLDHALAEFSINLPESLKIRPSTTAADEVRHPFISTKWILRQVASRYLPRKLAFRAKRGFPTSAFDRVRVAPDFLMNSWISHHYSLGKAAFRHIAEECSDADRLRLLMLDTWGRIAVCNEDPRRTRDALHRTLSFS